MTQIIQRFPFFHTYSIIAHDPDTGEFGGAVQSHWFSVGALVVWAEPGVGAVATQAMAEVSYGPLGLDLLRAGVNARRALDALLSTDDLAELRQVAMIDASGGPAAHTGKRCMAHAGHVTGKNFSAQANMMLNPGVPEAMADGFTASTGRPLAERLVAALEAAQAAGGDVRGQQSAALVVSSGKPGKAWENHPVDLRVEDHPAPVEEMKRLLRLHRSYELMNQGDAHLGRDEIEQALTAYSGAEQLAPETDEMPFWHAVTLLQLGRIEEALPIFARVFRMNPNWRLLLQRLPPVGMLECKDEDLRRVLELSVE